MDIRCERVKEREEKGPGMKIQKKSFPTEFQWFLH
jgi:hypothetical protein